MTYQEMIEKHRAELNAFPMAFAFNREQFTEGLQKLNASPAECLDIGGGGFIRKSDLTEFESMFDRHAAERSAAFQDAETLTAAIRYELGNHEYGLTRDPAPALDRLGINREDPHVEKCYQTARREYLKSYEEWYEREYLQTQDA